MKSRVIPKVLSSIAILSMVLTSEGISPPQTAYAKEEEKAKVQYQEITPPPIDTLTATNALTETLALTDTPIQENSPFIENISTPISSNAEIALNTIESVSASQENRIYSDPNGDFSFEFPPDWTVEDVLLENENPQTYDLLVDLYSGDNEMIFLSVWRGIESVNLSDLRETYLKPILSQNRTIKDYQGLINGNDLLMVVQEGTPNEMATIIFTVFQCSDNVILFKYLTKNSGVNLDSYKNLLMSFSCSGIESMETMVPEIPIISIVTMPEVTIMEDSCNGYWDPNGNPYTCYSGNCVWWANYSRPDIPNSWITDAWTWYSYAQTDNRFYVSDNPEPGAIAVWGTSAGLDPDHGHVAYVVGVNADGTFDVTEMSWPIGGPFINNYTNQPDVHFILGGVTFFENSNFNGSWERITSSTSDINYSWGASSVFIPASWDTIFYKNTNYDSSSWRHRYGETGFNALESSFWNLSLDYYSDGSNMNDNVRSAKAGYNVCFAVSTDFQSQDVGILGCEDPSTEPNDIIPPSGSWVNPGNGSTVNSGSIMLTVNASDNSGGSGVKEVRFSAKWNNQWSGVGDNGSSPYSVNWDWCASGVPDGDVELGFEVWDNAGLKWVYSDHYANIHVTKNYDCGSGGGDPLPGGSWNYHGWMNKYLAGYTNFETTVSWDNGNWPYIYFDWGSGGPYFPSHPDHNGEEFSVRLWRNVYFPGGNYDFNVDADDGIRVYVDGNIVVDRWWDGSGGGGGGRDISAGNHEVKVEFYENAGDARLSVVWYGPGYPRPDTDLPDGRITSPSNNSASNYSPLFISADAWDDVSGVDHVNFYVWYCDGACEWRIIGTDYSSPYTTNWDWSAISDQHVWLSLYIIDNSGKERYDAGGWVELDLDRVKPSVSITSPLEGNWLSNNQIEIHASASDTFSGVWKLQFFAGYYDVAGASVQEIPELPQPWLPEEIGNIGTSEVTSLDYWHEIGWDENGGDGWNFTWDATGVTYQSGVAVFVYAYDYAGNYEGAISSNLTLGPFASNDTFGSSINIPGLPYTNTQLNLIASESNDDPVYPCTSDTSQRYNTVWYSYTPSHIGKLDINTLGSNYDTVLAVWAGTQGNLANVACDDDSGGNLTSLVSVIVSSGVTYYIEVASYDSYVGDLKISVNYISSPYTDFDGDGVSDPAKFYASNGTAWWLKSSTGLWDSAWLGPETFDYVPRSDFDGDGMADPGKFNSVAGTVWYIKSSDSTWEGQYLGVDSYTYHEGSDFDGDGKTDPTKLIPNGAIWYIKSSTDAWEGFWLGPEAFEYVTGDFDGDGMNDPAKFIADPGVLWYWESSTSGWVGIFLGSDTYEYVSGSDFDGDGKDDPAKFYAATNTVWWLKSSTGLWDAAWMGPDTFDFVGGNDFDGDGKTDPAMYDPVTGILSWLKSSTGTWGSAEMGMDAYEIVN